MFFAQDKDAANRNLLISIIDAVIRGDTVLAPVIDEIMGEAHALASGKKDLFQVDRENHAYIALMARMEPEYFKQLNPKNITEEDYQVAISILQRKNELVRNFG